MWKAQKTVNTQESFINLWKTPAMLYICPGLKDPEVKYDFTTSRKDVWEV